jgi:hypothetical protein
MPSTPQYETRFIKPFRYNDDSQPPVNHRAGFVMCPGNIDLGDLGVVAHHFQVAMAEQRLQGEEVA